MTRAYSVVRRCLCPVAAPVAFGSSIVVVVLALGVRQRAPQIEVADVVA
jgi:hypothetical protein